MQYVVGIVLALVVCGLARASGLDRDRAFYTAMAFTVASYYVLFAAMSGSTETLVVESIVTTAFVLLALIGFMRNLWLVVASLGGHGLFDAVHDFVYVNTGVPDWWPAFCMAFDVAAAGILAALLMGSKVAVRPAPIAYGSAR
jgi:hypothetical protein